MAQLRWDQKLMSSGYHVVGAQRGSETPPGVELLLKLEVVSGVSEDEVSRWEKAECKAGAARRVLSFPFCCSRENSVWKRPLLSSTLWAEVEGEVAVLLRVWMWCGCQVDRRRRRCLCSVSGSCLSSSMIWDYLFTCFLRFNSDHLLFVFECLVPSCS